MWFGLRGTRSCPVWNEANDIVGDMAKQTNQIIKGWRAAIAQPARQALPDVGKGASAVKLEQCAAGRTEHGWRIFANQPVA